MNVEDLKEHVKSNPNVLNKLMFMGSSIRGSKSYWKSRCGELRDMVEQLGLPTIFLTMSAADLYWPDLYRLLTGKDVAEITMRERRKLLQDNPLIVDMFFQFRIECYIETVLEPKFGVIDYWYRIEYQHRGSPHFHGLCWLRDAPDVSKYSEASNEEKKHITKFFDKLVSAVNPEPDCADPDQHPCEILFEDVKNVETDLSQLLKTVQRHSCSRAYCKRFDKKSQKTICRFHFPMDFQSYSELKVNEVTSEIEFLPERNDRQMNKFNPFIIATWRANIDIAPVLSKSAVINYLTKYVSKSEVKSTTLKEICSGVCDALSGSDKVKKAIQRILIKNCVERDVSAQEVCHILTGAKLFSAGGRKFVVIYTNHSRWKPLPLNSNEMNVDAQGSPSQSNSTGMSFMEKYECRPLHMKELSMWDVAKNYDINTWRRCKKSNIVRVFPRLKLTSNEVENEEYYRQKVLLHVKWNQEQDLRQNGETWKDAFIRFKVAECFISGSEIDLIGNADKPDEVEDHDLLNQSENREDWMIASTLCPRGGVDSVELGRREVDINHDWHGNVSKYESYGDFEYLRNFIENAKKQETEPEVTTELPNITFTEQQEAVKQCMERQIAAVHEGTMTSIIKRVLVQGKAGTGKSLLIKYLIDKLTKEFGVQSFLLMGPTGVSAINIGGSTIHSTLKISPKKQDYKKLDGETSRKFCDAMEHVKFVIIDEYSMISCSLLGMIDQRLREGTGINEPFGDLFVYFFGDYKQLPPVIPPALFGGDCKSDIAKHGRNMFNSFEAYFVLQKVHRQKDEEFLKILDRMSNGETTYADYEVLKKRFTTNVSRDTHKQFENAIRLFANRDAVLQYNSSKLHNLKDELGNFVPIARVPAQHYGKGAGQGTEDEASGLSSVLYLGTGTRVMLRTNLWVKKGLVNGTMGSVIDLLYEKGKTSPEQAPEIIMVKFDSYNGPGIGPEHLVPLVPVTRSWTKKKTGEKCSRNQFPIVVCYGCTIHKSQGLTLEQAVIDIGKNEHSLGISYVGISRVKSLDGILLEPFPIKRLLSIKSRKEMKWRQDFEVTLGIRLLA